MEEKQNADGSLSGIREKDAFEVYRSGGYMGPAIAMQNVPAYPGGINLQFNIAGLNDNGGGLLQWQNNFPFDIIVTAHVLDVTTISAAACTVSFGSASASNTVSTNMVNGQDVHSATGTFNGGALSVKVTSGNWITGSKGGGSSSGLIGRVTIQGYQSNSTAGGP